MEVFFTLIMILSNPAHSSVGSTRCIRGRAMCCKLSRRSIGHLYICLLIKFNI